MKCFGESYRESKGVVKTTGEFSGRAMETMGSLKNSNGE